MTDRPFLPAIRFLEDYIDRLLFTLNYLRREEGMAPLILASRAHKPPPATPP